MVSSSNNLGNGTGSVRNFYGDKGVLKMSNWGNQHTVMKDRLDVTALLMENIAWIP